MGIPVIQKNSRLRLLYIPQKLLHHEVLHIQPILLIHFQSPFSCICKKVVPKELILWQCYRTILIVPLWKKKEGKIIINQIHYVLMSLVAQTFGRACLKKTITNIRNSKDTNRSATKDIRDYPFKMSANFHDF